MAFEHKVEIHLTGHGQGTVKLDGMELKAVTEIRLTSRVNSLNLLTLSLYVKDVVIDGPFKVERGKDDEVTLRDTILRG